MKFNESQILNQSLIQSMLKGQSSLKPKQKIMKQFFSLSLTLTSLVDGFTILVIYLLVSTTSGTFEMKIPREMILPEATQSELLAAKSITVRVQDNKYFINDRVLNIEQLGIVLRGERKINERIIVQADKRANFSSLNPVVLSGLRAGFSKISFAVLQGERN
ncbi:MAG: hypothetical protein A2Z20_10830 [Bdellovibrionales bacterium RBG_16_40_8]|nr:MAG: hypothetical protein A2Z20_10830 [Bdellovibrionales bacterium RBG_16_40_8]